MSDDPNKRGRQDRQAVSWQDHEIGYAISKAMEQNPGHDRDTVAKAVFAAKQAIEPSEGRDKLMVEIGRRLK